MQSIAEYLERINRLTQQNLDILKTLNDSFYTKKEHLLVTVEDNQYVIPSFITLENKINALQEGLNNLVNAPAAGEAYFQYDGNSKTIQVRGFNNTPNALTLDLNNTEKFYVENNSIFKDFITPNAHLKFDVTSIPDDICTVLVKKVVPVSSTAKLLFQSLLQVTENEVTTTQKSNTVAYSDLYKQLSILRKDTDYEEYDTVRQLPVRQSIGTGTYVITKIVKDDILGDLTEQLTLEFSTKTPLKYKKFDETIDVDLEPGQYLTTYDGRVKLQIVDVNSRSRQLVLNVVNGDYLDLAECKEEFDSVDDVTDMSKLRFFSVNDFSKDKYVDVTLEEDQYVAIFIAPLNSRMNVQAPWGNGVVLDTYQIRYVADETVDYNEFYNRYVSNIGDILKEIVTMTNNSITKYSYEEFNEFGTYKPVIDLDDLSVVQINRHLNNSLSIKRIRSLYSQKKQYEIDLGEVESKITATNTTLASVSFDDTTNLRTIYESQLSEYTRKKNEIVNAINTTTNEISLAVNESDIPIENAKYHIRGYFDWRPENNTDDTVLSTYGDHVKGIRVQYRYKNKDQVTGTAESFKNGTFIYSDWNMMESFDRMRHPDCSTTNTYSYGYDDVEDGANEPKFNQIDIPITQGESVDVRLQVVWDFGAPYIETTSDWSDIVNIEFPEQYLKDVQILDIIEENNSDIETNRFNNILIDRGVTKHIDDSQTDQDTLYFHHPEHIASGFYTEERRIIPLKDKLSTMDSAIVNLEDTVYGTNSENIKVEFVFDSTSTLIQPLQNNTVNVNVNVLSSDIIELPSGMTELDYVNIANLKITNTSNRTIRLYSIFPGNRNTNVTDTNYNMPLLYNTNIVPAGSESTSFDLSDNFVYLEQVRNQFTYLRSKDIFTGDTINAYDMTGSTRCTLLVSNSKGQICIDSDNVRDYKVLNPGESIILPIMFTFITHDSATGMYRPYQSGNPDLEMSLDLRMSLYNDPQNYFIKIHQVQGDEATLHGKIKESQSNLTKYNSVIAKVYQPTTENANVRTRVKKSRVS